MTLDHQAGASVRRLPGRRPDDDGVCRFIEGLVPGVFGVPAAELRGKTRGRARVAFARQAAMYLAHVHFGLRPAAVGAYFGRDRTTVAHACARIEDNRDKPRWSDIFDCLERALDDWARDLPGAPAS